MKDESQQQVPPGIVAFKGIAGNIQTFEKSGVSHYNNWVKWRMQEPNTIHIISVEEIQWSIGDEEEAYGKVESFEYDFDDQRWLMKTNCGTLNVVKCKHKPPPPSQQDRSVSQPGKEDYDQKVIDEIYDEIHRDLPNLTDWEVMRIAIKIKTITVDYHKLIYAARTILDEWENSETASSIAIATWHKLRDATYEPLKRMAEKSRPA